MGNSGLSGLSGLSGVCGRAPILTTYTIDVGVDGYAGYFGGSYPPSTPDATTTFTDYALLAKGNFGGTYVNFVALLNFDTSTIPDDETVVSASLKIWPETVDTADSPAINADYYNWGSTADVADWTTTVGTTAINGQSFTGWTTSGYQTIALSNVAANVPVNGTTYLRLGINLTMSSGLGQNRLRFYVEEALSGTRKPQLVVVTTK